MKCQSKKTGQLYKKSYKPEELKPFSCDPKHQWLKRIQLQQSNHGHFSNLKRKLKNQLKKLTQGQNLRFQRLFQKLTPTKAVEFHYSKNKQKSCYNHKAQQLKKANNLQLYWTITYLTKNKTLKTIIKRKRKKRKQVKKKKCQHL